MFAAIPFVELLAALVAAIGALLGLKMADLESVKSLVRRWTDSKIVTFEGGKIEYVTPASPEASIAEAIRSYLDYEELVRRALEDCFSKSIQTRYLKDQSDFYVELEKMRIGIEAKSNFDSVPVEHIRRLLANQGAESLLLVSKVPFERATMQKLLNEVDKDRLKFASGSDLASLKRSVKAAVEGN